MFLLKELLNLALTLSIIKASSMTLMDNGGMGYLVGEGDCCIAMVAFMTGTLQGEYLMEKAVL